VFVKIAAAGDPSSYVWRFSGTTAAAAVLSAYGGVNQTAPIVGAAGRSNPASPSITAPSVDGAAGQLLVGFFGIATNATIQPPPAMFERGEAIASGKTKVAVEVSDDLLDETAPTGARIAVASKGATNAGQVLVLAPAG
jgi:hypothetical protein